MEATGPASPGAAYQPARQEYRSHLPISSLCFQALQTMAVPFYPCSSPADLRPALLTGEAAWLNTAAAQRWVNSAGPSQTVPLGDSGLDQGSNSAQERRRPLGRFSDPTGGN